MKIHTAKTSSQKLGGGFTFLNTFSKYAQRQGVKIVPTQDADIIFLAGPTMIEAKEGRKFLADMKKKGKKIVLRVDNAVRDSRNRNTGSSRMYDFAQLADLVIYQSEWAKNFLSPFLKKDGPVILNGADEEVFNNNGKTQPKEGTPQYLYVQFNRDETKQWHQAWYEYIMIQRENPKAHLWIVGNFSPELQEYNFDFFMGERFRYAGIQENGLDMAEYYRGTDTLMLPYFNDACSNTLIEARLCGVENVIHNGTGGTQEIMDATLDELTATKMVNQYIKEFEKLT